MKRVMSEARLAAQSRPGTTHDLRHWHRHRRRARLDEMHRRHGERVLARLLAPSERADCRQAQAPARFLAKRFAAKEAFGKALGTGVRAPVLLPSIAVVHDALGKPSSNSPPARRLRGGARPHRHVPSAMSRIMSCICHSGATMSQPPRSEKSPLQMPLGPLMIDIAGTELSALDRERLCHPLVGA